MNIKPLRDAALRSLHFDADVQRAAHRALRDEELNARPRCSALLGIVRAIIEAVEELPPAWYYDEDQAVKALDALHAYEAALSAEVMA